MNTDQLIAQTRSRFEHAVARQVLKEKYQAKLLFASQGGMWRAGPELQTTLLTCPGEHAVILDQYETPVKVNTKELYATSQHHWQEQMNAWLVEFEEQSKNR